MHTHWSCVVGSRMHATIAPPFDLPTRVLGPRTRVGTVGTVVTAAIHAINAIVSLARRKSGLGVGWPVRWTRQATTPGVLLIRSRPEICGSS